MQELEARQKLEKQLAKEEFLETMQTCDNRRVLFSGFFQGWKRKGVETPKSWCGGGHSCCDFLNVAAFGFGEKKGLPPGILGECIEQNYLPLFPWLNQVFFEKAHQKYNS